MKLIKSIALSLFGFCTVFTLYALEPAERVNKSSVSPDTIARLPKPSIAPLKDIFTTSLSVSLSLACADKCCDDASIIYTTDGTNPKKSSTARTYLSPFTISQSVIVKAYTKSARACKKESELIEKQYSLIGPLPLPTVLPGQGRVVFGKKITIFIKGFEQDTTVKVYYTLDGSDPSIAGIKYNDPFELHKSSIMRVIAVSTTGDYLNSPIFYRKYTCYLALSPKPAFNPPSVNFRNKIEVTLYVPKIEDNENVTIFYTLDGTIPSIFSKMYQKPITLNEATEVKAIALRKGYRPSKVVSEKYVKGEQKVVPKAEVKPEGGIYGGGIPPITFTHKLERAMIMYTLDESEPTMASDLWDRKLLHLNAPVTLKVKVFRSDWVPSVTVTEKYEYETLPEPLANFPTGTVFTDTLKVTLRVPGFRNETGLKIYYTLDGSDPVAYSQQYKPGTCINLTNSGIIKAFARRIGYYESKISTLEFFNMIRVVHAYYQDKDKDRKIESAVLYFDKSLTGPPSLIEFTDPYTFRKHKIMNGEPVTTGPWKNKCILITFDSPFGPGGNFPSGHYGRIPLPGEFDTAPFLMHDSTSSHHVFPLTKIDIEKIFINSLQYDNQNIAVLNNPFEPGASKLPTIIQELNEFRTSTGTAILIKPLHPSIGTAVIYDALGNKVIVRKQLIEDPATGILFCVWDGKNNKRRLVESGTYLVILSLEEKQSHESTERKVTLVVRR